MSFRHLGVVATSWGPDQPVQSHRLIRAPVVVTNSYGRWYQSEKLVVWKEVNIIAPQLVNEGHL